MGTIEWEGQVGVTTLLNAAVLKFAIRRALVDHNVPFRTCVGISLCLLVPSAPRFANHFC